MSIGTQEYYDMIAQFEKDVKNCTSLRATRFDKEERSLWPKGIVYQDGQVNALFTLYQLGYSFGRCVYL